MFNFALARREQELIQLFLGISLARAGRGLGLLWDSLPLYADLRGGQTWPGPHAPSRMHRAWDRAGQRDLPNAGSGKVSARVPCSLSLSLSLSPGLTTFLTSVPPPPDLGPQTPPCLLASVWPQKIRLFQLQGEWTGIYFWISRRGWGLDDLLGLREEGTEGEDP